MATNPCCCCSLQKGVKAIAIFGMVKATLLIVMVIVGVILAAVGSNAGYLDINSREVNAAIGVVAIVITIFVIAICLTSFALAILLWKAAENRNEKYSRIWLIVTSILWIVALFQLFWLISSRSSMNIPITIVQLLLDMYFIWVVMAFRKELLEQETQGFVVQGGSGSGGGHAESGPSSSYKMEQ